MYMYSRDTSIKMVWRKKTENKNHNNQEKIHSPVSFMSAKDACTLKKYVAYFVAVSIYTIHMCVLVSFLLL